MSKTLTLGSFFDGIGGWLLAAKHAGVKPVWASEIDDFPATVSAHHFPQVKQLGDITKINVDELEPTDIICAGSPCQDLSVAGKREGLAGERSGLFRTAIDIVHRLRNRTGMPRYFVWENVPGAFSSNKGLDFRAVLEEVSQANIPMPKDNRWAESGVVEWDGGSLAWRVLDAQYWGVPQRRKRIFLVADFGEFTAGEILFVEQGLHGDSSESEREREEAAANVGTSTDSAVYESHPSDCRVKGPVKVSPACTAKWHKGSADTPLVMSVYENHAQDSRIKGPLNVAPTVSATFGMGGNNTPIVHSTETKIIENHPNDSRVKYKEDNVFQTLSSRMGTGGGNVPMVHTIAIEGNGSRPSHKGNGYKETDKMYTLNATEIHGIALNSKTVRRLTCLECERLMGLPDSWTDVEFKGKPAPDSRRYKAIGNGMAQPCADFVIRRIAEVVSNEA